MNEVIMKYCKNYNNITHCEFLDDDLFSKKMVEFYKSAVLKTKSDQISINRIIKIDKTMRKYIDDYNFSKKLRNSVDVASILNSKIDLTDSVFDYTMDFLDKYNDDLDAPIVNTRWI